MESHPRQLDELKTRLHEVEDVNAAAALLSWDQTTYMPPGGGAARGRQLATLGQIAHERFTDPAVGRLLDALRPYEEQLPFDSDDASLIRVTRRDYERLVKVPSEFTARLEAHMAATYQVWVDARPKNDFAAVRPYLEQTLALSRELAGFFPGFQHVADPLIDFADTGMTAETVRALFDELRSELAPIVTAITSQEPADDSCLRQEFPEGDQWAFGESAIKQIGYDFTRGRQDRSAHPYTTKFSLGDVRITTRVNPRDLREALFATIHEAGHAMYEQGIRREMEGTPLARGASAGVHESQSRLWENRVGRSRGFWHHFYPKLQRVFASQLGTVPLDAFYRAVNKVERSLIRVEADEVTYNLHIMLRFGLELDLLEGKLRVTDLPEAWRARFQQDIGIAPPDDRDGAMQDTHWYGGYIGGMFQGYTLGNVLSAQVYDCAVRAHAHIPDEIERGEFGTLLGWLTDQIYQHGRKFTMAELAERVTGGPLRIEPYVSYLRQKYGELYRLPY